MRKVLASDWGESPERVLDEIDTEPAAAASIGQVYRGRTHDGREVAIKVQYPGIAESVEADMRSLMLLSPLLRRLMPGLEVKAVLAEMRERIVEECDYELEASNHRRLARFWRDHPFVRVPGVDTELSRRRVLVTDWVDGMGFAEVTREPDAVRDRYARDRLPVLLRDRAQPRSRPRRSPPGQLSAAAPMDGSRSLTSA